MEKIDNIHEIQKISLHLLEVFDDFCKKNRLHYFLAWGTLLGAIRHKGFIPWDDDIDIMMPRQDFNRLVELDIKEPAKDVRFYSYKQSNLYENVNCRLSDKRTLVDLFHLENPVNQGIWLTIFPIDNLPDDKSKRSSFLRSIYWRYRLLFIITEKDSFLNTRPFFKKTVIKVLKKLIGLAERKKRFLALHSLMERYKDVETKEVGILSIGTGKKTHFTKKCFDEVLMQSFEGKQYPIPAGYDEILTNTYGDYLQLPPLEQRVPKHDFVAYYK